MAARAKKRRKLKHQKTRLECDKRRALERVLQLEQKPEGKEQKIKNSEDKKGFGAIGFRGRMPASQKLGCLFTVSL